MKALWLILALTFSTPAFASDYEVFLGIHDVHWFAYRMQIKAKRAGYPFAKLTEVRPNVYKVTLGPFKTQEEAEKAESKIKAIVRDLKGSKVQQVKN